MNIFHLSRDPSVAAESLCDKHVPKMLLETAQMLSTGLRKVINTPDEDIEGVYKKAYPYHPMTVWVGSSPHNFQWAVFHGLSIGLEYRARFGGNHASEKIIKNIESKAWQVGFLSEETVSLFHKKMQTPPQCMPDEYKSENYIQAYRNYYIGEKSYFAKWQRGRCEPKWWVSHVS